MPFLIVSTIGVFLSRKSRVADHRGRQITPYLPKETFSAKSTQCIPLKAYMKLYATSLWTYKPGMRKEILFWGPGGKYYYSRAKFLGRRLLIEVQRSLVALEDATAVWK